MLIVTADEDDRTAGNRILTVVSGEHVQPGVRSSQAVSHYGVLHTVEDAFGLAHLGPAAESIAGIWR
jgi:acid phosphatase